MGHGWPYTTQAPRNQCPKGAEQIHIALCFPFLERLPLTYSSICWNGRLVKFCNICWNVQVEYGETMQASSQAKLMFETVSAPPQSKPRPPEIWPEASSREPAAKFRLCRLPLELPNSFSAATRRHRVKTAFHTHPLSCDLHFWLWEHHLVINMHQIACYSKAERGSHLFFGNGSKHHSIMLQSTEWKGRAVTSRQWQSTCCAYKRTQVQCLASFTSRSSGSKLGKASFPTWGPGEPSPISVD